MTVGPIATKIVKGVANVFPTKSVRIATFLKILMTSIRGAEKVMHRCAEKCS